MDENFFKKKSSNCIIKGELKKNNNKIKNNKGRDKKKLSHIYNKNMALKVNKTMKQKLTKAQLNEERKIDK